MCVYEAFECIVTGDRGEGGGSRTWDLVRLWNCKASKGSNVNGRNSKVSRGSVLTVNGA